MERMKASDFPPEVLKLFDGFVHGRINRRTFLLNINFFGSGMIHVRSRFDAISQIQK